MGTSDLAHQEETHDKRTRSQRPARLLGTACGDMKDDSATSESYLLGDALPGTNAADFLNTL